MAFILFWDSPHCREANWIQHYSICFSIRDKKSNVQEVRVLNRIFRWTSEGIEYEADPRHVEIIPKQLNIGECKAVITYGAKDEGQAKVFLFFYPRL